MKYVALWFAIFVCVAVVIGSTDWWRYCQLCLHGVRGQAVIAEVSTERDGGVTYEYQVAGETFRKTGSPNAPSSQLRQGQPILVYYNSEHAEESTLKEPKVLLRDETVAVCAGGLFVSLFVTLAVASRVGASALGWIKIRKGPKTIVLHSAYSLDKCRIRLAATMDDESFSSLCASGRAGSVLGTIRGDLFSLQKRRKHNSSALFFFGRLVASADGTDIEGDFRIHPLSKLLIICGLSFAGVSALGGFSQALLSGAFDDPLDALRQSGPILLVLVGVVGFGAAMRELDKWLARKQKGAIIEFLKSSLNADVVSAPPIL